jgi:hypothetical protein
LATTGSLCSTAVRLVEQWREIERDVPEGSSEARLTLRLEAGERERAAALLGPLNPGLSPDGIMFSSRRGGGPASPEGVRRLLARLDREGMRGHLELRGTTQAAAPEEVEQRPTLAAAWDEAVAALPSDWSDLLGEVEFRSSDQLTRAALLLSPLNPARPPEEPDLWALRFRVARRFGYGASPEMVRRCFERCDAEGIRGTVSVLRALSDTHPVATQGPVWQIAGRTT